MLEINSSHGNLFFSKILDLYFISILYFCFILQFVHAGRGGLFSLAKSNMKLQFLNKFRQRMTISKKKRDLLSNNPKSL